MGYVTHLIIKTLLLFKSVGLIILSVDLSLSLSNMQLLRLKRSLTFMRSKSVENFFQRSQSDAYLPKELLSGVLPSSPRLFTGPAPGNSSAVLPSPSISSRPAPFCVQPRPAQTHSFLEHVFRRPTSCSLCKLIIAGKQGMKTLSIFALLSSFQQLLPDLAFPLAFPLPSL